MIIPIHTELIRLESTASTKDDLLHEIAAVTAESGLAAKVSEAKLYSALAERENLSSTGMQNGVAIPHGRFETLDDFVVGMVYHRKGLDFDAIDGQKSHFFFFIFGPSIERHTHIKILSSLSKLIRDNSTLKQIAKARNPEDVVALLRTPQGAEPDSSTTSEQCLFHLQIQDEAVFEDVLEICTSLSESTVSVVDGVNAAAYLHKMPLFAAFWNEEVQRFSKIIITAVDKRLMNELIRRINLLKDEHHAGIAVAVSDLMYFDGDPEN